MLQECWQNIPSFVCKDIKYVHSSHVNSYFMVFVITVNIYTNPYAWIKQQPLKLVAKLVMKERAFKEHIYHMKLWILDVTS